MSWTNVMTAELPLEAEEDRLSDSRCLLRLDRLIEEHYRAPLLSIHCVQGGQIEVQRAGRCSRIDDDTYLIVEAGEPFTLRSCGSSSVEVMSVFIDRQVLDNAGAAGAPQPWALGPGTHPQMPWELQSHDTLISPVLRFLRHHAVVAREDSAWLDEQLCFLAQRLALKAELTRRRIAAISAARSSTRQEIWYRVGLATDFIHSHYARPLTLAAIARAADSSPHHVLRMFREVHGVTPREFLQRKRVSAARRLLASGVMSLADAASQVGFADRSTLSRRMKRQ
jgi:AraC-like DNA-binding protein